MGIVRKQSILSSIYIYIGFVIGAVNILILFPRYFTTEQIGLTRILLDVAMMFSTVCTLGSIATVLKFYPVYKTHLPREKNDLPALSIVLCTIGCLLLLIAVPLLKPWILRKFGARSPLFIDYFDLIYPFTITLTFFSLFEAYAWSLKKTVLSNALKEFAFRLLTSVLIVLFIVGWISFPEFIGLYSWIFLIPVLIFLYSIIRQKELPLNFSASARASADLPLAVGPAMSATVGSARTPRPVRFERRRRVPLHNQRCLDFARHERLGRRLQGDPACSSRP